MQVPIWLNDPDDLLSFKRFRSTLVTLNQLNPEKFYSPEEVSMRADVAYVAHASSRLHWAFHLCFLQVYKERLYERYGFKYPDETGLTTFLEVYPEFKRVNRSEQRNLWLEANWMNIYLWHFGKRYYRKGLMVGVIPKFIEGLNVKYVTGGGQKDSTSMRALIFEREGLLRRPELKRERALYRENLRIRAEAQGKVWQVGVGAMDLTDDEGGMGAGIGESTEVDGDGFVKMNSALADSAGLQVAGTAVDAVNMEDEIVTASGTAEEDAGVVPGAIGADIGAAQLEHSKGGITIDDMGATGVSGTVGAEVTSSTATGADATVSGNISASPAAAMTASLTASDTSTVDLPVGGTATPASEDQNPTVVRARAPAATAFRAAASGINLNSKAGRKRRRAEQAANQSLNAAAALGASAPDSLGGDAVSMATLAEAMGIAKFIFASLLEQAVMRDV